MRAGSYNHSLVPCRHLQLHRLDKLENMLLPCTRDLGPEHQFVTTRDCMHNLMTEQAIYSRVNYHSQRIILTFPRHGAGREKYILPQAGLGGSPGQSIVSPLPCDLWKELQVVPCKTSVTEQEISIETLLTGFA